MEYAMAHNINVNSVAVQAKSTALDLTQSRLSRIPSANLGLNSSFNTGNNQDPTTFSRVTENYLSAGMQLQSSAEIFNFFSKRASIVANFWELMAAQASVNKLKSDIA